MPQVAPTVVDTNDNDLKTLHLLNTNFYRFILPLEGVFWQVFPLFEGDECVIVLTQKAIDTLVLRYNIINCCC